jgi:hypothetical protein
MDLDIDEIFQQVISLENPTPNSYSLGFELDSLKELFEFLMTFTTKLCKHFYGNENGNVDLTTLSSDEFYHIDIYLKAIGFTSKLNITPINQYNLMWIYMNNYNRIQITPLTQLSDLYMGIELNNILYIISFTSLRITTNNSDNNNFFSNVIYPSETF